MNWMFTVPYPYVNAEEVVARPQLRKDVGGYGGRGFWI